MNRSYKNISLWFAAIISIMATSCNTLEMPIFKSLDNIQVSSLQDSVTIQSAVTIYNPNWHRLSVNELEYFVMLDSVKIGEGKTSESFSIDGKDSLELITSFNFSKMHSEQIISIHDSSLIKVVCSTLIPIIKKKFYFDIDLNILDHIEKLTEDIISKERIVIQNINLNSISLKEIQMDFNVIISNHIGLSYEIQDLEFEVFTSKSLDHRIGKTSKKENFTIQNDSLNILNINMNLDPIATAGSMFFNRLNKSENLHMRCYGTIILNNIKLPFELTKKLEYNLGSNNIKIGGR